MCRTRRKLPRAKRPLLPVSAKTSEWATIAAAIRPQHCARGREAPLRPAPKLLRWPVWPTKLAC